jgi:hypothetical protein
MYSVLNCNNVAKHTEFYLERGYLKEKVAVSVYNSQITAAGDPQRWLRDTLYPQ